MKALRFFISALVLPYQLVSCTNVANYYLKSTKIDSNVSIIDGDTISFLQNDKKQTIRLFGIDVPETFKDNIQKLAKFENFYAHQARIYLTNMINNKELYYRFIKHDKYNRIIAFLYYKTSINTYSDVGLELVRNGLARVHYISVDSKHKYAVNEKNLVEYFYKLKAAENEAKIQRINIWQHAQKDVFYKP
ncbi:thermonuclease family protein [Mycoplasmopsis agalactiae]|uniref:thermonuclease family protein n=1 Tax=Mycoplasmopsis agalactiae TaxID=2110 RepID=UPI001455F034|nr:thermonuclease family protein [Mycoplasmopsis agalactiae]MCE6056881.1 thermonuclease family protein [Mycoplasmopsis agalactiae]MCE6095055.1 thermonuclease family protein [Mycoplasmopsis agalactiae]NLS34707.1 nuclease [Mycoplasmopsis agalactiae]